MYVHISGVLLKLATNHNMTTHNQHIRNKKTATAASQQKIAPSRIEKDSERSEKLKRQFILRAQSVATIET